MIFLLSCKLCILGQTLRRCNKTLTCEWQFLMIIMVVLKCMMVLLGALTEVHRTETHSMSAEDIWQRKFDELWLKLEKNTQDSFCTALCKWLVKSEAD